MSGWLAFIVGVLVGILLASTTSLHF